MTPAEVTWASEHAVHIKAPTGTPAAWHHAIRAAHIAGIHDAVVGSATLQLHFAPSANPDTLINHIQRALKNPSTHQHTAPQTTVEIPICSDPDLAPDLEHVAQNASITTHQAANLHAQADYRVRFLGFAPGFAYIDGLPQQLRTPRLDAPRPRVRAGSVAIAGAQTGIYPRDSPGGWRIIGATPLRMFDPHRDPPALLAPGHRVRFKQIARQEFDDIEASHNR